MDATTQEDLDDVTKVIGDKLREKYPDIGFIILACSPPVLLDHEDGSSTVHQPFTCRSNAANAAMFMTVMARGLAFAADQEATPQIVTPDGWTN